MDSNLPAMAAALGEILQPEAVQPNRERHRGQLIEADSDAAAVRRFLLEYQDSPETLRSYAKECERLLLWTRLVRNKPLSGLLREDFDAYRLFLQAPPADWRSRAPRPRRFRRGHPLAGQPNPDWRPFSGPLGDSSIAVALNILNSLFAYLVEAGYLAGNPLALMRSRRKGRGPAVRKPKRLLNELQWQAVVEAAEDLPATTPRQAAARDRAVYLVMLFYASGARISEIANGGMEDLLRTVVIGGWNCTGKAARTAGCRSARRRWPMSAATVRAWGFLHRPAPGRSVPWCSSSRMPGDGRPTRASAGARSTTSWWRCSVGPPHVSRRGCRTRPRHCARPLRTGCDTPTPRTCWTRAPTCERYRKAWDTRA